MPASIFGDRFLGRREPAWHRVGEVFDEPLTMTEAIVRAGVDFEINKHPSYAYVENGEGEVELIPTGQFAVIREPVKDDPVHRVLATVGKEWTPLQARTLATMLDPLTEKYPVETIGALGHGEQIFMTLDAGESKIAGEDHKLYYLVTDHRTGTGAMQIAFTPVRVVCQNTLMSGLSSAKVNVRLTHTRNIQNDAEWYMGLFNQMLSVKETVIPVMDSLATVTIDNKEVDKVLEKAYPEASKPRRLQLANSITADDVGKDVWKKLLTDRKDLVEEYEKRQARVDKLREGAKERFEVFNDEYSHLANTPWAIWQAVVETEDYRKGHSDSTAIFGQRADIKARAFAQAYSYVK